MFGNLGAFVNGNMFMGLFGADVGVKLDNAEQATLLAQKGAGPFGPEGHRMAGYVSLPATWRSDLAEAEVWVAKAFAGAASLPAKVKKPSKKPGAKVSGAKVSGAKVSGAKVSGEKVSGEKVSGEKVSGAQVTGSGSRVKKST